MQYVSLGRRIAAAVIDSVIVFFGLGFAIAALTHSVTSGPEGVSFQLEGGPAGALVGLWFVYYVALEATLGATIGKWVMGIRVRTLEGAAIGLRAAVARNLFRAIDVGVACIGAIVIWLSPRRQRLGDLAAHTVVVRPC